jgi:hypothetical protein
MFEPFYGLIFPIVLVLRNTSTVTKSKGFTITLEIWDSKAIHGDRKSVEIQVDLFG